MEFGNPIVGGEDLIRESIKSPNFETDPENGVQGWQISRDGTATFYNLVIGSQDYIIDQNGNAVFASVSADQINLNGTSLDSLLEDFPRGIIALATISGTSAGYTGAAQILAGRIVIPGADSNRQYVFGGSRLHFDSGTITTIDRMNLDVRINWNSPATTSSTLLWAHQERVTDTSAFDQDINFRHPFQVSPPNGDGVDDLHIAVFFSSEDTSGMTMQGVTGSRLYVEDIGLAITYTDFSLGTGTTPVQTYTKTYAANGSASFQSNGTNRGVASCYQGYYSGTNGNQYSMIAFPYATIQADLAGATVTKTELYLNNNHFYSNAGGTAIIGYHNQSSVSGNHSSSQITDNVDTESFTYGQAKWFTVTNTIGNAFKNNTAKGIALGPGPSSSQSYYGYFAGNGESGEPQLRITYTK